MYRPLLCRGAMLLAPRLCRPASPVPRELTRDSDGRQWAMSVDRLKADGWDFEQIFPQLVEVLTREELQHPLIGDAIKRFREVIEYNVPGGKRNRGLSVVTSFRELASPKLQTQENFRRALIVGWCVELLQAFFLVADDIMDQSITRRGHVCWYRKEGIGLDAINDSFLLEAALYQLLRKYTKGQPYYVNLLELFLQ
ncbi:farnesyl pyrophosphate synthase, partial [Rhincodon typus]|uniref:farnesyl pyrophosphate synthase n=1 Tax=Rhincodon typus TaxID=259920 RepID=UPI00202E628A